MGYTFKILPTDIQTGSFEDLPTEIQTKIFGYISGDADLLECRLTCKLWHVLSNQVFYEKIILYDRGIEKSDVFMKIMNEHGEYLKGLIKHITMECSDTYKEQFQTLLKFFADECPNIRTVILDAQLEDEFYQKELNHKNWKHLENIYINSYSKSNIAIEIAKKHQETIKKLKFHESDELILCDEKENELEVKEKLAKFKLLKTVSIIIQKPRHLSSLDSWIPENLKSLTLNLKNDPIEHTIISSQYIDLRKFDPCFSIKKLILWLTLRDDNAIKYLMYKFPRLEKLILEWDNMIPVSKDTKEAFTNYLFNIKNISLRYKLVRTSDGSMDLSFIKRLIESSKAKNSKNQGNLTVCFYTSGGFASYADIDKKTKNGVKSYEIRIGLNGSHKLDFLKSLGTDLTGLEIAKCDDDGLDLNQIFKHCPNLNCLDVDGFDAILDEEFKENTMNLKMLSYGHSECFPSKFLSDRFKFFLNLTTLAFSGSKDTAIDLSNIITAFPNLNYLEIVNAELSLSSLDKKSSTLKRLSLNWCKFSSNTFFSDVSRCLPNVHELNLRISGDNLESNKLILNMPESSLQGLNIYMIYDNFKPSVAVLKVSLLDDKKTGNNKLYYANEGPAKECTETEYESVISKDSDTFQLIVNCRKIPRMVQFHNYTSGMSFKAGTFLR